MTAIKEEKMDSIQLRDYMEALVHRIPCSTQFLLGKHAWFEMDGTIILQGGGEIASCLKLLKICAHNKKYSNDDHIYKIISTMNEADKQIRSLKTQSKIMKDFNSDQERLSNMLEAFNNNPKRYSCIKLDDLNVNWFDDTHGLRNARGKVFPKELLKRGFIINKTECLRVFDEVIKEKKVNKITYRFLE